eukprot:sb/3464527/
MNNMLKVCTPVSGTVTGTLQFNIPSHPRSPHLTAFLEDLSQSDDFCCLLEEGEVVETGKFLFSPVEDGLVEITPLKGTELPVRLPVKHLQQLSDLCASFERASKEFTIDLHTTCNVPQSLYNMVASDFIGHGYMNLSPDPDYDNVSALVVSDDLDSFNGLHQREGNFESLEIPQLPVRDIVPMEIGSVDSTVAAIDDILPYLGMTPAETSPAPMVTMQPASMVTTAGNDPVTGLPTVDPVLETELPTELPVEEEEKLVPFEGQPLPPDGFNAVGALAEFLIKLGCNDPVYEPETLSSPNNNVFRDKVSFWIQDKHFSFPSVTSFQRKKDAKTHVAWLAWNAVKNNIIRRAEEVSNSATSLSPSRGSGRLSLGSSVRLWKNDLQQQYQAMGGDISQILRYNSCMVPGVDLTPRFRCTLTVTPPGESPRTFTSSGESKNKKASELEAAEKAFRELFPTHV